MEEHKMNWNQMAKLCPRHRNGKMKLQNKDTRKTTHSGFK